MTTRVAQVYNNVDALKIATASNCERFAMGGNRVVLIFHRPLCP